ncbi:MAG: 3-dehydroquinate synthase [Nitrospirota bacterium]
MEIVKVNLGPRSYDIFIGRALLPSLGERTKSAGLNGRAGILTNDTVGPIYAKRIIDSVRGAGYEVSVFSLPDGEKYKTVESMTSIYDWLLAEGFDRKSFLVALGGGVIGDIAGFAAATFMRGIDFVQVPTTLLAQVDSSVGGKTGVNRPLGKNMIGAFHQPRLVLSDVDTLKTLPAEEFISGLAEVVKYGVIRDEEFFAWLEDNAEAVLEMRPKALAHLIGRSCEIKAEVVGADEREGGLRAILNFGHTVGHAVESLTDYTGYRHGEAVSIGMAAAARLANLQGLCGPEVAERLIKLLTRFGLPVEFPGNLSPDSVLQSIGHDKKAEGGKVKFVMPTKIGDVAITKEWEEKALLKCL